MFFTLSMAEFKWDDLLKEILETVYRRPFTWEEVQALEQPERNKIIAENYVQSSLHFHKRTEKIFSLMKHEDFFNSSTDTPYHVANYFYRVEYQARGE